MPVRGWPTMMIGRTTCSSATAGGCLRQSSMRRRFDRSVTTPSPRHPDADLVELGGGGQRLEEEVETLLPARCAEVVQAGRRDGGLDEPVAGVR